MRQVPSYLFIGNGRVSRHFQHYFSHLKLDYQVWQRSDGRSLLQQKLQQSTHVLLLIKDDAIEDFIANELVSRNPAAAGRGLTRSSGSDPSLLTGYIHFSGSLVTDHAYGAHPLMTFSNDLYDVEQYQAIPFVIDEDAPDFSELLPGLPNPHWRLPKHLKAKYHALCVLSGNFSCLLWNKLFSDFESELNLPSQIAHPYLQQQMNNLINHPKQALTGPLVRNDQKTINNNLAALSGDAYQKIYKSFVEYYQNTQKQNEETSCQS